MYYIYIYYKVLGVVFVSQLIGLNFPGWYPLKQPVACSFKYALWALSETWIWWLEWDKRDILCLIGNIHFRVKRLFFLIILYPSILIVFSYVLDQYLLIVLITLYWLSPYLSSVTVHDHPGDHHFRGEWRSSWTLALKVGFLKRSNSAQAL